MCNKRNGTLYVGVTSDLIQRVYKHKVNYYQNSFTAKYQLHNLVYYELCDDMNQAITREKQLKKYKRVEKLRLIEAMNSTWIDLWSNIIR